MKKTQQEKIKFATGWLNRHPDINLKTIRNGIKIGRNQLCPCGSKMKFKYCHGKRWI